MNTYSDEEIEDFCSWLKALPESPKPTRIPPAALLKQAWEAVKAHQVYLIEQGDYQTSFLLRAAADGDKNVVIDNALSENQHWYLSREHIPDNPDEQILRVACHEDWLKGRRVSIVIAGQRYDLGTINRRGVVEIKISSTVDFQQDIKLEITEATSSN